MFLKSRQYFSALITSFWIFQEPILLKFYFRLIQAALGSLTVQDFSLQQDTSRIFRAANRISRCNGLLNIFIYTSKNLNTFEKNK
jgi:hypothetical protein